jgi:hypothetical protein
MPPGTSAEGIFVSGFGFGRTLHGDVPRTRAAADGTFTLKIASDHGYSLGIGDTEWASDGWTGVIMADDTAPPAAITLDVYPATPLKVQVSRGPHHKGVANASVGFRIQRHFSWTDVQGKRRNALGGASGWLQTDENGTALAGVGRGELHLQLTGEWDEQQVVNVKGDAPVSIEFHRNWLGKRKVAGRLLVDNALHKPSSSIVVRAWTSPKAGLPPPAAIDTVVRPDGTFEIEFDAVDASILVRDPEQHLSGFAQLGVDDTTVDVALSPTAVYSGVAVDQGGRPIVAKTVRLAPRDTMGDSDVRAADDQVTDSEGRFKFDAVAVNVPLRLSTPDKIYGQKVNFHGQRYFLPSEQRETERIVVPVGDVKSDSLVERLAKAIRDGRLAGMHVLVVLEGDESRSVVRFVEGFSDYALLPDVLHYLVLVANPKTVASETATVAQLGAECPAAGEVVLMALDGEGKQLGRQRLAAGDAGAIQQRADFVKKHLPPARDAKARWLAAREEARQTGRRLLVVEGGSRCGPCFRLAHWIDDQHALLAKDYLVLEVIEEIEENSREVVQWLNAPKMAGVPWFVIAEPDGTILATSEGPLGNIGCPSDFEGIRHFREMLSRTAQRLTQEDIDQLVRSLSPTGQ